MTSTNMIEKRQNISETRSDVIVSYLIAGDAWLRTTAFFRTTVFAYKLCRCYSKLVRQRLQTVNQHQSIQIFNMR